VSSTASATPSSYEQLGVRIQKIINSPTAQRSRAALIFRLEQESPDDWETLLRRSQKTTTSPSPIATMAACRFSGPYRRKTDCA
jgi:hypothetical protein